MSRQRLFGTDGVRGVANIELTARLAMQLGAAAGHWAAKGVPHGRDGKPCVIIGRDTRLSGDMLEAAIAAGLASMGVDVINVDVVPTPAVAQIVLAKGAAAGIVISASHNPFEDNGIKLFGPNGKKLPDSVEDEIEEIMGRLAEIDPPTGGGIGRIHETREPVQCYLERVERTAGGREAAPLRGLSLVMDCANGAAYEVAPRLFRELGADVRVIHAEPDGVNINVECGSTRPAEMARMVVDSGASAGLAFDGDADRVMLADERGAIVDGDRMMAILAMDLHARGALPGAVVVSTIMSNVGLEQALAADGIRLHRTDVGDRYVAEAMDRLGAAVGGEQSGHILLPELTPTGDGLVTALHVLRVMRATGRTLSELASVVTSCPQLLKSVRVRSKVGWREDEAIRGAIARGQERLGSAEWLSVRASGTEPLIRVMAQGTDEAMVHSVVNDICGIIEARLGAE
ncbi:MAG TPA: phosphoglucosamine mutase [Chthonomonadaceae bacterium]|nr:phosphoglucosamine mutase [Chthonomonadaceae bacterium]